MAIKNKSDIQKQEIDLMGPQGNAFALLGIAKGLSRDLGLDFGTISTQMMSGDYENLIKVFDDNFGDYVDLVR